MHCRNYPWSNCQSTLSIKSSRFNEARVLLKIKAIKSAQSDKILICENNVKENLNNNIHLSIRNPQTAPIKLICQYGDL